MSDRESKLEQNPYMRSFYMNPPAPASRPINTNRDPNPFEPGRGTRHIRDQSRLGTYSLHSEADMMRLGERASCDLVAAAIGSSPLQKSRPRASPLSAVRRAHNPGYYEPAQKSSKSNKRRYADRESSSELSEHEDGDFSPALKRRLAPTPMKLRKVQAGSKQSKTHRYLSDEEYTEEMRDSAKEIDKDAEEEEALERLLAQRAEKGLSSPSYTTPTSKRRNRGACTTPMNSTIYPTPTGNGSNILKKKPKGKPVPQDLKTADAADRMMFRWKSAGRPWEEIRDEYYRLSGAKPAASSLSVRYIKLSENLAANGLKDEIHDSFFETYPDRNYLKTFTKPDVQEVALTKAVVEAKIKTAPALWKEVVVQMKASTGEDFAAPSLRKRYEEIEKRQFFLSEQNPAKHNQWPALPRVNHGSRVDLHGTPELVPVAASDINIADHAHGQNRGNRHVSTDTANDSLFTDRSAGNANDFESFNTAKGQKRSGVFIDSKVKVGDMLNKSRSAIEKENEKENESPSHTHPRISYGQIDYAFEMASDGSMSLSMGPSTPTPTTAVGKALMGTGVCGGVDANPRPCLVGYGDSDDSD